MGITLQENQALFLDTAPLIYFWEKHERYYPAMASLFDEIYAKNVQCCVSLITYIEVVTFPLKQKQETIAAKYRNYLTNSRNFQLVPMDIAIADRTARLRSEFGLKTPDAIQLATADICGADYVLTNDKAWRKVGRPERIVLVEELA